MHLQEAGVIKLSGIEKFYENHVVKTYVLRNVNLEVKEGEFISIMGPSGAGKTTLLNIIGMLDVPSNGEYHFLDEPVHKMSERKLTELHKRYIGFVFQSYHLIDELTVYENLETPLLYQKVNANDRKGRVAETLAGSTSSRRRIYFQINYLADSSSLSLSQEPSSLSRD